MHNAPNSLRLVQAIVCNRRKMAMVWKMHSCPRLQRHILARMRSKFVQCLDTLITKKWMERSTSVSVCRTKSRAQQGIQRTNCAFRRTMISFFENFTSASVTAIITTTMQLLHLIRWSTTAQQFTSSHAQNRGIRVQKARNRNVCTQNRQRTNEREKNANKNNRIRHE